MSNFQTNQPTKEKEISGILKKSTDTDQFKSRYSLSNGFKDKKVTFQDNLVSYDKSINNQNMNKNNLIANLENNNHFNTNYFNSEKKIRYNFINTAVSSGNNLMNCSNNFKNIYVDKNVYNKNINLENKSTYNLSARNISYNEKNLKK